MASASAERASHRARSPASVTVRARLPSARPRWNGLGIVRTRLRARACSPRQARDSATLRIAAALCLAVMTLSAPRSARSTSRRARTESPVRTAVRTTSDSVLTCCRGSSTSMATSSAAARSPAEHRALATSARARARTPARVAVSARARARTRSPAVRYVSSNDSRARLCRSATTMPFSSASARSGAPKAAHSAGRVTGMSSFLAFSASWCTARRAMASRSGSPSPRISSCATLISAKAAASPPVTWSIRLWRAASVACAATRGRSPASRRVRK
ncbi:hypothetical protein SCANM63S_09612 [Streptomyces canarius]